MHARNRSCFALKEEERRGMMVMGARLLGVDLRGLDSTGARLRESEVRR